MFCYFVIAFMPRKQFAPELHRFAIVGVDCQHRSARCKVDLHSATDIYAHVLISCGMFSKKPGITGTRIMFGITVWAQAMVLCMIEVTKVGNNL